MKYSIAKSLIFSLLLAPALAALSSVRAYAAPEVIDRIVATVNGRVILQSDLDEALCYEALLSNRPLSGLSDEERQSVLDRLIDQELLREQMKSADFRHATDEEVSARVAEARQQYPQAASDETWRTVLAHVRQQIDVMRLVDARLRPAVEIDSKSIEAYYQDQFIPKLKLSGATQVPLEAVSGKIRELLTQEKVSEMLVSWLQTLRSEGEIKIPGVSSSASDLGVQSR
jgi:parvulin-like peptidyl-prolyl isomerase